MPTAPSIRRGFPFPSRSISKPISHGSTGPSSSWSRSRAARRDRLSMRSPMASSPRRSAASSGPISAISPPAILDWEMCALGAPLEDVAGAADPLWAHERPERPGGMIARDEAIRLWEEESGLKADPVRLRWWEIFNSLKGLAIWISAGKEYQTGANRDPVLAFSSWYCTDVHNRVLAR